MSQPVIPGSNSVQPFCPEPMVSRQLSLVEWCLPDCSPEQSTRESATVQELLQCLQDADEKAKRNFVTSDENTNRHKDGATDNRMGDWDFVAEPSSARSTLDQLVDMATLMFQAEIAIISLKAGESDEILAAKGAKKESQQIRRLEPIGHKICHQGTVVVPDLAADVRFQELASRGFRFYVRVPLNTPDGERVGTVSLLDTKPRPEGFKTHQLLLLNHVSELAMQSLLEMRKLRRLEKKYQSSSRVDTAMIHDLLTPLTAVELALSLMQDDKDFLGKLTKQQKESLTIANACTDVLGKLCRKLRDQHNTIYKAQIEENDMVTTLPNTAPEKLLQTPAIGAGLRTDSLPVLHCIEEPSHETIVDSSGKNDHECKLRPTPATATTSIKEDCLEKKRSALVIEDSIVVRKVVAHALSKIGFEIEAAVNGMEGLHHLQNSTYDVVLCDFLMPVMDGFDAVTQYREWERTHRPWFRQYIIGMSAHANDKDVARGLGAGMDSYRPKPLTYKGLKDIVDACDVKRRQNAMFKPPPGVGADRKISFLPTLVSQQKMCLIAGRARDCFDLARMTEALGWKSLIVHDGKDALHALKKRNWDAVLLDENLPFLNGKETAQHFRRWERENRVNCQANVFLCTSSRPGGVAQVSSCVDGELAKPIDPKTFAQILQKAGKPSLNIIMR